MGKATNPTPEVMLIAGNAAAFRSHAIRDLFNRIAKTHGLPMGGAHIPRRYVATEAAERYGIEAAAAQLGHTTKTQTEVYLKPHSEKKAEVARNLAKVLAV